MDGILQRASGKLSLEHFLKGLRKCCVLLGSALFWPFRAATGCTVFSGFMTLKKQCVDIPWGVFPAVLVDGSAAFGKAHGSKSVVLGDDDVPGLHPVCDGKIGTVGTFVHDHGFCAVLLDAMGGVADENAFHSVLMQSATAMLTTGQASASMRTFMVSPRCHYSKRKAKAQ